MCKPEACKGCPLEKIGSGFTQIEVGARYESSKLLIIGDASGESESREGLPFRPHAQSGSLLADAMREVALGRGDTAITNIVRCRPPKDWLEGAPWAYGAISQCVREYLTPAIHRLQPRAILALGGAAFRTLTNAPKGKYGTLDYIRGYVQSGVGAAEGIPVIGTYHPAFLRRGAAHLTPLLQRDLRRSYLLAKGKLAWGIPSDLEYQTAPTLSEAWEYARNIDPDLPLAFDIETPRSTREDEDERTSFTDRDIKLFQCTQRRGAGIALPYRDEYREVIREILSKRNTKVGFNNWNFDDSVLASNGIDVGRTDDAMVMFGTLQPDLPKNLQAAAQFCGFPFPWKHYSETDLGFYGVCDVDATLAVYEYVKASLERDGGWEAYRTYFSGVWPILRDMSARGIPIDERRRLELKELIRTEDLKINADIQSQVPEEVLTSKHAKGGYKNPPILKCEDCGWKGRTDHECDGEVVPYADLAEANGLILREIIVGEDEKCRCLKKDRGACAVCAGSGIIPVGLVEMRWTGLKEFNPNSPPQVKRFMRYMKHPVPKHSKRTDASGESSETTEVKELERLFVKTKHPIYPLLIKKRQLTKVEGTYVDGWEPWNDGAVHTTYTYQTAIWQLSSKGPNVQNGLKHADKEKYPFKYQLAKSFNGMQRAKEGKTLINFDFKSFFPITMAHDFNMPRYCRLARLDIHSFVTCYFLHLPERQNLFDRSDEDMLALFKALKKDSRFKFTRDYKSKRVILGMGNGLFYRKMYQTHREDFENEGEAKALYETVIGLFPELPAGQAAVKKKAAEEGKLVNKFGAVRHFYDVQRFDRKQQKVVGGDQAEAAIAFLPASHAFGHMRDVMLRLREKEWDEKYGLINTIHDSLTFHCDLSLKDECLSNVKEEMERPSKILIYPEMAPGGVWVGVEGGWGESMAEIK